MNLIKVVLVFRYIKSLSDGHIQYFLLNLKLHKQVRSQLKSEGWGGGGVAN